MTAEEILGIQNIYENLVIVGGGYVDWEFAAIFPAFGCRVVLVDRQTACLAPTV